MTVRLPEMPLLFLPPRGNRSGLRAVRALSAGRSVPGAPCAFSLVAAAAAGESATEASYPCPCEGMLNSLQLMLDLRSCTVLPAPQRGSSPASTGALPVVVLLHSGSAQGRRAWSPWGHGRGALAAQCRHEPGRFTISKPCRTSMGARTYPEAYFAENMVAVPLHMLPY